MITINLIPEKQREYLAKERMFRIALKQVSLLVTIPVVFVGMLAMLMFVRSIELNEIENTDIQNQQLGAYKELISYENDFRSANKDIAEIDSVIRGGLFWSEIFNELDKLSSDGIGLTSFLSNDYSLHLDGIAETRQKLLDFQSSLENNKCFSEINSPLSNLVSRDNIEFTLDLNISPDCLRNNKYE